MKKAFLAATALIALLTLVSGTRAEEWAASTGKNPRNIESATMWISKYEFGFEFFCSANDSEDGLLGAKFFGPALPRLYGQDGDTAKLSLLMTMHGGVLHREEWDAYYFDGGLGDQAWLGPIHAGEAELNAIARALKFDILNEQGELVYSFGTKGTAAGIAQIRQTCHFKSGPPQSVQAE